MGKTRVHGRDGSNKPEISAGHTHQLLQEGKMEHITVLIEYKDLESVPRFHANMEALGGKVIAVDFSKETADMVLGNDEQQS